MKELIGKEIKSVYISEGKECICFNLEDNNRYLYYAIGECCAQAFFESINNIEYIYGTVSKVEELSFRRTLREEDGDVEELFGIKLTTNKGIVDIEMRLDHNGYYGGESIFVDSEHYTVEHNKNEATIRFNTDNSNTKKFLYWELDISYTTPDPDDIRYKGSPSEEKRKTKYREYLDSKIKILMKKIKS